MSNIVALAGAEQIQAAPVQSPTSIAGRTDRHVHHIGPCHWRTVTLQSHLARCQDRRILARFCDNQPRRRVILIETSNRREGFTVEALVEGACARRMSFARHMLVRKF